MSSPQTAAVSQVLTDVLIPATMQDMPERFVRTLRLNQKPSVLNSLFPIIFSVCEFG